MRSCAVFGMIFFKGEAFLQAGEDRVILKKPGGSNSAKVSLYNKGARWRTERRLHER